MAKKVLHHDRDCVNLFREGGPLLGTLCYTGNGTQISLPEHASIPALLEQCSRCNSALFAAVKEDEAHSLDLVKLCVDDANLGRMSFPKIAGHVDLDGRVFSPRFCIEQGVRADGTQKLRAVDDFTRGGCNPCTAASEKLHYDNLDVFIASLRAMAKQHSTALELWKADIDAAYRRVPVAPEHRKFAWVVFKRLGKPVISQHFSLPFGSLASVHHWDRVGESSLPRYYFRACALHCRFTPACYCETSVAPPGAEVLLFLLA